MLPVFHFIIVFSVTVRDLGVTLDQELTFSPRINRLCRDCYYQLSQLRIISRSLTSTATAIFVHAFVSARLDYCSTLYAGLTGLRLGCLERVVRGFALLRASYVAFLELVTFLPTR